jgi:AcrR family transcriptional regulator
MSRPSRNTDQTLIQAGRKLIYRCGLAGLRVREVAEVAGVNLGMFHYYFRTKQEFTHRILKAIYEDFFKAFTLETGREGDPVERLRRALLILGRFLRDNRELVLALIRDVIDGHKPTIEFLKENFFRHATILAHLLEEAQRKGQLKKRPFPTSMAFLASSVAMPNLIVTILGRTATKKILDVPIEKATRQILSDEGLTERIEMALRGLAREGGN